MAAELERGDSSATRQSKRLLLNEKHICSGEPGPRGLTYDESSVMYSLLWNQPSLYPSQNSYSLRHSNPLVRKGGQADAKTASTGLPLFYTDSLDQPLSEEEGERGSEGGEERGGEAPEVITEIHEESPNVVHRVPPWSTQSRRTVHYIAPSTEADIASRVRSAVGYEFPPIMGRMVEANVQRMWQKWKERGIVHAQSAEEQKLYQQLVVDTHVFLVREVERRLLPVDSDSSDSEDSPRRHTHPCYERPVLLSPGEFYSSSPSSSDEDTIRGKRKRRKTKRTWNRALPQTKKVTKSLRHEKVRIRISRQREEFGTNTSSSNGESGEEVDPEREEGGESNGGKNRNLSSGEEEMRDGTSGDEEVSEDRDMVDLDEQGEGEKGAMEERDVREKEKAVNETGSVTQCLRKSMRREQGVVDDAVSAGAVSGREDDDREWRQPSKRKLCARSISNTRRK